VDADATVTLDLLRQAKGGDRAALDRLMQHCYERVRNIVRVRLSAQLRQRVDGSDILQETFTAAVRDFDRFDIGDNGNIINWLATIAQHQICAAADFHNALKRDAARDRPLPSGDDSSSSLHTPAASGPSPSEQVSQREQVERVLTCLAEMPEEPRELILLRDFAGASWEAVAAALPGSTPDSARMRYGTAVRELARRMLQHGRPPPQGGALGA
jgi:RNA polymerase sigma-70 factor (ECF subfamily)